MQRCCPTSVLTQLFRDCSGQSSNHMHMAKHLRHSPDWPLCLGSHLHWLTMLTLTFAPSTGTRTLLCAGGSPDRCQTDQQMNDRQESNPQTLSVGVNTPCHTMSCAHPKQLTAGPQKCDAEVLPLPSANSTVQTSWQPELNRMHTANDPCHETLSASSLQVHCCCWCSLWECLFI